MATPPTTTTTNVEETKKSKCPHGDLPSCKQYGDVVRIDSVKAATRVMAKMRDFQARLRHAKAHGWTVKMVEYKGEVTNNVDGPHEQCEDWACRREYIMLPDEPICYYLPDYFWANCNICPHCDLV